MERNLVIAVAAAGAVVCGGTVLGLALSNDGKDTTSNPVSAVEEVHVSGGASKDDTSGGNDDTTTPTGTVPELALATALAEQPGLVTEIELEDDDARTWQIEILGTDDTWYDVEVSLDGTQVLGSHTSDDDDNDDVVRLLNGEATQAAEAVRLAQEATAAGLREASVDDDGHWELELRDEDGKEYELTIDLASGQITTENGDDDGNDDRDEQNDGDDNGGNDDGGNDDGGNDDGDDDGDDNNDDRGDG